MDVWLTSARDELARVAGLAGEDLAIDEHAAATILDLARLAARSSGERTNAPLLSYLAGFAVARGADLDDLAAALRKPR
ncbi:MAG TPA: DUF6457 domain-containing protein [Gaiellaceae bacterium]